MMKNLTLRKTIMYLIIVCGMILSAISANLYGTSSYHPMFLIGEVISMCGIL